MPSNMSSHKRKRPQHDEEEEDGSEYFSEVSVDPSDDDEIDISSALTGKRIRAKVSKPGSGQGPINNGKDVSSDEDEGDIIRMSISKRNVKSGTEVLKKTKGKKIVKGEVGGGSFQSMGS